MVGGTLGSVESVQSSSNDCRKETGTLGSHDQGHLSFSRE
jgi:hypothetical protein